MTDAEKVAALTATIAAVFAIDARGIEYGDSDRQRLENVFEVLHTADTGEALRALEAKTLREAAYDLEQFHNDYKGGEVLRGMAGARAAVPTGGERL